MLILIHHTAQPAWTANSDLRGAPEQYLNKGRADVEKKGYSAAVKPLTEAIKLNPDLAEAYFLRARSFDMIGQPMRALKDVGKYIDLKPHDPKGYILKGDINNFNQDHKEAVDSYSFALRLDSRSVDARIGRGLAYAAMEKYDLAIKDYEDALKDNRLHHEALTNLGIALALSGKPEQALKKLTEALALERDLEWRPRLNRLIDEISQVHAEQSRQTPPPFKRVPGQLLEKPW